MPRRKPALVAAAVLSLGGCSAQDTRVCDIPMLVPKSAAEMASLARELGRARQLVSDSVARLRLPLAFREIDTEGKGAVAASKVASLIAQRRPALIVGSLLSSETHAFLQPTLSDSVVVLANGSSDPTFTTETWRRPFDGFFRNWASDDVEGQAMAQHVSARGYRAVAVLHATDKYSSALASRFSSVFRSLHGEIPGGTVEYDQNDPQLPQILSRYADKPVDAFYVVGLPVDLGVLYAGLRAGGAGEANKKKPFFSAVAVESSDFVKSAGGPRAISEVIYSAPLLDTGSEPYRRFAALYRSKFSAEPDVFSAVAYDALWLAVLSVDSGKECTSTAVKQFLYGLRTPYLGASGATLFDSLGNVITKDVAIRQMTPSGGVLLERRTAAQGR